jgi:aldehyde dehydrogenase (NAD+)
MLEKLKLTIDGEERDPSTGEWLESFNPYTGEPWTLIPKCAAADVDAAVEAAHRAFKSGPWRAMTQTERGALLVRLADVIAANAERLAEIEVRDNGKLIAEMAAQLRYVPQWYRYFGGLADKIEGAVLPSDKPGIFSFTRPEPLGVIGCITPWNSPILLLTWKLAAILAAGNTAVIKPSEHASASTLAFARLFKEAGFPPGVVNVVTGLGPDVGAPLAAHPKVAKLAFTGGEAGGLAVYAAAAKGLKPVTLELGGKSPNIVFEDAKLDNAVKGVVSGIFAATGQTCIAGSRALVQDSIHDAFVEKLLALAKTARMGDPLSPDTQVGPVTTRAQYQKVLDYIEIAKNEGARCVLGGGPATRPGLGKGWFVEPTIFDEVTNDMRIAREEVFGPVLSIIRFKDQAEAVAIANDSPYGLAAGVWTEKVARALEVSAALEAGTVWVNTYRAVSFMAPFGGYKRSGLGRESGKESIHEFLQTKTVWISTASDVPNPFVMR